MVGKGSVNHNSRKFKAENVDGSRTHLNIDYCNEPIKKIYHELFDEALKRYNEKQTRADRKIENYYEKIRNSKQEKPFHELILQIGDKENMSAESENGQLARQILDEYYRGFQERNPNLKVFSAHLHMDEATPHLHIDFVPFTTGSKRGLDTRVSLKQALAAQGFKGGTRGDTEWNQWVSAEKSALAFVMERHGIEWEHKGTHEKHLSVLDYKKQERATELEQLGAKIEKKQAEFNVLSERVLNYDNGLENLKNVEEMLDNTINLANRIFQHNALNLNVGESIQIINPQTGDLMELTIPLFGAVASNLPFVPFEIIPDDDKAIVSQIPLFETLDQRSDLYCYIATKISDVIKPDGLLGIITSNSWMGTKTGSKFVETLRQKYNILQVHISGKGRWFKNADIVTTIIILQKKGNREDITRFFLWKKSLCDLAMNIENEDKLINSALLGKELDNTVTTMASYSQHQIAELLKLKVSYNSLFHKVDWLIETNDKAVPINKVYTVFRGSRRGCNSLFYPAPDEHQIEPSYIKKVLKNARNVTTLITDANSDAFCCDKSIEELKNLNHFGALEWINKFKDQRNGVGKPLPDALKRANMYWYELKTSEIAEVFTMMNPDKRLFFAKFNMHYSIGVLNLLCLQKGIAINERSSRWITANKRSKIQLFEQHFPNCNYKNEELASSVIAWFALGE